MSNFIHNIYTFFSYLYTLLFGTLFSRKPVRQGTITPYPLDLECGRSNTRADSGETSVVMPGVFQNELMSSPVPASPTMSPSMSTPITPPSPRNHALSLYAFRYNPAGIQPTMSAHSELSPPASPVTPTAFRLPGHSPQPGFTHRSVSMSSISTNNHSNALPSDPSHLATHCQGPSTSSNCSSVCASDAPSNQSNIASPCSAVSTSSHSRSSSRVRHRKQKALIWSKDMSTITMSASTSSVSSATSSLSPGHSNLGNPQYHYPGSRQSGRPPRYRTTPLSPLSHIKHDPSVSYKRNTARMSTATRKQSRALSQISTRSEDPVSVVRKAFGEMRTSQDKHTTVCIRARINRETAKSFGGMDIVDEEEEGDESQNQVESETGSTAGSVCSTPSSLGPPVTPRTPFAATAGFRVLDDTMILTDVEAEADDEFSSGVDTDAAIESDPSVYSIATVRAHFDEEPSPSDTLPLQPGTAGDFSTSTTCMSLRSTCLPYLQGHSPRPSSASLSVTANGLCIHAFASARSDMSVSGSLSGSGSVISPMSAKSFKTFRRIAAREMGIQDGLGDVGGGDKDRKSVRPQPSFSQRDVERTVSVMSNVWKDAVSFASYSVYLHGDGKKKDLAGSASRAAEAASPSSHSHMGDGIVSSSSTSCVGTNVTAIAMATMPGVLLGLDVEESSRLALFKFGTPIPITESDSLDLVAVDLDLAMEAGLEMEKMRARARKGVGISVGVGAGTGFDGLGGLVCARDSLALTNQPRGSRNPKRSGLGSVGSLANINVPRNLSCASQAGVQGKQEYGDKRGVSGSFGSYGNASTDANLNYHHGTDGAGYGHGYMKDLARFHMKNMTKDTLAMRDSAHWSDIIQLG
ncbi:hypothetical protein K435DRAFT_283594 [Dendrothele bispora CBS 962.96]|uniref:Uncharacterized protein n=1 Tax=Dendrothele bispora (strain CBS 962.96) TaxID=1314807 RepID=A0A4S8LLV0_DENBC|nr:hypothetical protein K435DRAFT_283594 [Dendrothele bispora CBS 962.96]